MVEFDYRGVVVKFGVYNAWEGYNIQHYVRDFVLDFYVARIYHTTFITQ